MICKSSRYLVFCLPLMLVFGCGKSVEQKQLEEAGQKMEDAGKKMEEAMKQGGQGFGEAMQKMGEAMTAGKKVEPVDFRALKELLPESLPGMKRPVPMVRRLQPLGSTWLRQKGNTGEKPKEISTSRSLTWAT